MENSSKDYTKGNLTVTWTPSLCMHSANCVKRLHTVFDPKRSPWIDLELGEISEICQAIDLCPSGALTYTINEPKMEKELSPKAVSVFPRPNGPLIVTGNIEVQDAEGNVIKKMERASFCRCGHSGKQPFCDGSHNRMGFVG